MNKLSKSRFVTVKQVAGMMECSESSAKRETDKASFPKPYRFGKRKRWDRAEVDAYIETCR
ncbi:MAG: hypothetical protein CMN74_03690 [Sphingorhabdus sp.]|nr:hypothetical protein [Sphingorhabdus sp.]|tara:strand:+ start:1666 stop:1848 length:183 start_codon:yes stop_codon:yes gene_type:complete